MRLGLIGRYADRGVLRGWCDFVLVPAGHTVVARWIDTTWTGDEFMTLDESRQQCEQNRQDLADADVVLYHPNWSPSPGRCVDLGLALALNKPVIVVMAADWHELPSGDRTIYLRGARFCATQDAVLDELARLEQMPEDAVKSSLIPNTSIQHADLGNEEDAPC